MNKLLKQFFKALTWKKLISMFIIALAIMLIGTAIDFAMHTLSPEYAVPSFYFPDKIIFGTIFFFLGLILFRKLHPTNKAITISLITVLLLQIRYAITGYPIDFVIIFLFIHFGAFLMPAWALMNFFDKYIR